MSPQPQPSVPAPPPPPPPPYVPQYVPAYVPVYVPAYPPVPTSPGLSSAKYLGGIGSLLIVASFLPSIGGPLGIIGVVLVLMAGKRISQAVNDPSIYQNLLYGAVAVLISGVVGIVLLASAFFAIFGLNPPSAFDWAHWTPTAGEIAGIAVAFVVGLAVVWIGLFMAALYVRRACDRAAEKLHIDLFKTAGLWFVIGAGLTIIVVGFIILPIAAILFAAAFFSIPEGTTQQAPTPHAPA